MTGSPKQYLIFMLASLSFIIMHTDANAFSVEIQAGGGQTQMSGSGPLATCADCQPSMSIKKADAAIVFNTWERVDLFVGAEYVKSNTVTHFTMVATDYSVDYSFDYKALTYGIRIKPIVGNRWQSYLHLGGLLAKANYEAELNGQNTSFFLSSNRVSSSFSRARAGIGGVIDITKQLGVKIEAAFTPSITTYTYTVKNVNSATGQIENRNVSGKADLFDITLGLRFTF